MPVIGVTARLPSVGVAMLVAALVAPQRADADPAAAQRHFEAAQQAFVMRDFAGAASSFEAAYDEEPHPAALFNAGVAWAEAKKQAHAANCLSVSLAGDGLTPEQTSDGKRRLKLAMPSLAIVKVTAPEKAMVRLDDHCPIAAPATLFAEEGSHVIRVDLPDGTRLTREVTAPAPGSPVLEIDIRPQAKQAQPPPEPPVAPPERWLSGRRIAGFATLGSSLIFGGAAIGLGVSGLSARDEFVEGGRVDAELRDDAIRMRDTANVLWGVAAGAVVVGTLLIAIPPLGGDEAATTEPAVARLRIGPSAVDVLVSW